MSTRVESDLDFGGVARLLNLSAPITNEEPIRTADLAGLKQVLQDLVFPVGWVNYSYSTSEPGWLLVDGDLTIGDTGSGADRAGPEYEALFSLAKLAQPNTGVEDFASGDTVELRLANCVLAARSAVSSRLTVAGSGINGASLGSQGGSETHTLVESELPSNTKTEWEPNRTGSFRNNLEGGSNGNQTNTLRTHGLDGNDDPHQNAQPTAVLNLFVKL